MKRHITVYIDADLLAETDELAMAAGATRSWVVEFALRREIEFWALDAMLDKITPENRHEEINFGTNEDKFRRLNRNDSR